MNTDLKKTLHRSVDLIGTARKTDVRKSQQIYIAVFYTSDRERSREVENGQSHRTLERNCAATRIVIEGSAKARNPQLFDFLKIIE